MLKNQIYFVSFFCITIFILNTVSSEMIKYEDPKLQAILNNIKIDSAIKYVKELSGEINVSIDGESVNIGSRYYANQGNTYAEKYILQKFNDFKVSSYIQDFGDGGRNIIGIKKGTKYPTWKFIICAHFDSYSSNLSVAPGADDNASGTAAVLEAARILTGYNTEYTIEFALWDIEEIGLYGSNYYAQKAKNNNDTLMGVMNLDMIAYDSQNDDKLLLNFQQNSYAALMTTRLASMNTTYSIGLKLADNYSTGLSSDHRSFSNVGYPAVLLIEDEKNGDFNAYYHSPNDRVAAFNIPYYEKCLKLSIVTLASLARVEENTTYVKILEKLSDNISIKTFPNPFNSTININFSLPSNNNISIIVYDQLGREIETIYKGDLSAGEHTFRWNPANKPTGIYNLVLLTNSGRETARVVYLK
jgi:Zn-dependent M28 family amino/carboxypeptidase